ncbi:MAG: hypothetical protein EBR05_09070 [Marivivens sp.]|nr:hypothetical protein [Marivivens sp.]NBT52092.1 hypothetical protein [Marivivens sp.]NBX09939.1 hypothetical protein [Marivivens sp.]NCW69054.1 hypothetical protein [Marivivens sp.]NDH03188.1 hypothetical protein [Marivivens sp.]
MGLDMYLRLRHSTEYGKSFDTFDNAYGSDWNCTTKIYDVISWRKANAIHKWFVDNVQDGQDDCGRYPVSIEQLHKLRFACHAALDCYEKGDMEGAASEMPTTSGFFFGCTDYDDYYAEDLHNTSVVCSKLIKTLKANEGRGYFTVEYESSW